MTTRNRETGWRRDKVGLGLWPHQGKVAIAGWGMSPADRRWDGVTLETSLGAYALLAAQQALDRAGYIAAVRPVQPESVAGPAEKGGHD